MTTYPMKCRIRADGGGPVRVDVYDDIGDGGWFSEGLTAKSFAAQLADVRGPLDIHINSYGGDVGDGIAIGSAIRDHKGFKTTVVDGFACSIASVIAQAGDERVMQPGAMMMVHDAGSTRTGNEADFLAAAAVLGKHSDNIAGIYASRAGGTAERWRDIMRAETWYTAEEAVAAGLADRVGTGSAEMPAGFDVGAFAMIPGRIAARLRSLPRASTTLVVNADGSHAPMTGTHSHVHPAFGGQGGDSSHEHEHAHDGDASHSHDHGNAAEDRAGRMSGEADPGRCCPACGPDCACMSGDASARTSRRVLGIESMPAGWTPPVAKALPVHHTATTDETWDGPAAVAAMPNDDTVLKYCHAWESDEAASTPHREGDDDADDKKGNYKFPHHKTKGGPANLAACRNGLARLSGASIPDGDRAGVEAHLRAHLADGSDDDGGAGNHAHLDLSGVDLGELGNSLKEAMK